VGWAPTRPPAFSLAKVRSSEGPPKCGPFSLGGELCPGPRLCKTTGYRSAGRAAAGGHAPSRGPRTTSHHLQERERAGAEHGANSQLRAAPPTAQATFPCVHIVGRSGVVEIAGCRLCVSPSTNSSCVAAGQHRKSPASGPEFAGHVAQLDHEHVVHHGRSHRFRVPPEGAKVLPGQLQ
jgi:hypothetical protein